LFFALADAVVKVVPKAMREGKAPQLKTGFVEDFVIEVKEHACAVQAQAQVGRGLD
jgi:hypothetical protein